MAAENKEDDKQRPVYRSPEERRDAGLGREITGWLQISGLLEIERERINSDFSNNINTREDSGTSQALQIGLDFDFSESFTAELILESEHAKKTHSKTEEAIISFDLEPWGIEFGRQSLPFGEYYSYFITGPLIEFGETYADVLVIDYTMENQIEIAAYLFDSKINPVNQNNNIDWGINLEYKNKEESTVIGLGYLSDLAESDEKFLEDFAHISMQDAPAWNIYALFNLPSVTFSAEKVIATKRFSELDTGINQPSAYSVEMAYAPTATTQIAFRIEGSNEYEDAPEKRYGINLTWLPMHNIIISVDYLTGEYKKGFVSDDDDNELKQDKLLAAQLSFAF